MNFFLLATTTAQTTTRFFYEDWIIVKPFIWLFSQIMNGIMWLLDQVGIYNLALYIVLFTIITKMLLLPFTIKQQKTARLQAYINPEIQAIQKKYAGKTDQLSQQKMLEEQRAVQAKYGVSTFSGCLPMLIQMPILFALYPVIYRLNEYVSYLTVLQGKLTAEQLEKMYMLGPINLQEAPGFRLTLALIIPILVMVAQFLQSKFLTSRQTQQQSGDNPAAGMMKSMNFVMPLMLGFMAIQFPAFLGWYWFIQSLVMAVQQLIINKNLDKKGIDQIIAENVEKANKKRARKGQSPIAERATMYTRNLTAQNQASQEKERMNASEKEAKLKEATEYYNSRAAAPGSLAAKANMVRDYNEKNNKK